MDFKIKARIINKSDVRTFTNQKGEGKLFSIDILDRQGQDCNCSFFGDAVD
jgi:replication factor A1